MIGLGISPKQINASTRLWSVKLSEGTSPLWLWVNLGHGIAAVNAEEAAGGMETRYRLKVPIKAILDKQDGEEVSVKIPAGASLVRFAQPQEASTTLFGMIGVYWEGRHYSVYPNELALKAERVQAA